MNPIGNRLADNTAEKKIVIWAMVMYAIAFLWIFLITQGFPIGDVDDWVVIKISKDLSWSSLFENLIRPWSRSEYWVNQVNLVDQISYKRTIHGIILKSIEAVFGLRFLPFFLVKAFFFSGTVALVFTYLFKITRSLFFAFTGAFFFLLIPAHYAHILWISDPVTVVHFFIILGMGVFALLTVNLDQNGSLRKFLLLLCAFLMVGWLAMKTKEPGLILPLTTGAYTLIHLFRWKTQKLKSFLLLLVSALLAFQIVPIEHLRDTQQALGFHGAYLFRMLFRNYDCGYENEPTTAFVSLQHIWPVSIARTFGFFFLWILVLFTLLYWIKKFRAKQQELPRFLDHPLVRISALWAMVEIFLMGLFQPEPRFLSGTMIPLTLLAIRLVWCVLPMWTPPWNVLFLGLYIFSWGWSSFYMNFQHVIWLRMQIGQRDSRYMNTAWIIYKDQFPDKSPTWWDVGLFYCPAYVVKSPVYPRMEDVVFYTELPYESWNKTKTGSLDDFERYAQKGAIYYVTSSKDKFVNHPNIVLFDTVSGANKNSVFERLVFRLKRKKPGPLYIFKYVGH